MKIVIQTQHCENYGAHSWDGKGECPQYWKFKGGNTYVVPGLSVEQVMRVKDRGIPTLKSLIEDYNDYFKEYVLDWSICDDGDKVCEDYETPFELFYEQGRWVARRTVKNDEYGYMRREIASMTEQYVMAMGGDRTDWVSKYTMRDGSVLTNQELETFLSKVA